MKGNFWRPLASVMAAVACCALPNLCFAQDDAPATHIGAPRDWSSQHVIYAHPDTPEEADLNGRRAEWNRNAQDPRFVIALTSRLQAQSDAEINTQSLMQAINDASPAPRQLPAVRLASAAQQKKDAKIARDWSMSLGSGGVGTVGTYPAKYSFDINAAPSCANDFVVFTTAAAGSSTQATLVAFSNLYKTTCSGTVPATFWAYNTGTGAKTQTSPVLSYYDGGKQVAFVQTSSSNQAQLVLLKWSSTSPGTAGAPTAPTSVTSANYRTCTAPCMTVFTFNGTPTDTYSSPFIDYGGDVLWVGDDNSKLHKFTGVFKGTPAEVTSGGFPAAVDGTAGLNVSPPVYDFAGHVFVGTSSTAAAGGALYRIDASTGVATKSARLANASTGPGVRGSPVLDISNSILYAFTFADNTTNCSGSSCAAVYRFALNFAANNAGSEVTVGIGYAPVALYMGAFDSAYWNSANGTGNLYVCGTTPTTNAPNALWKIPITAGVMQTPVQGPTIASSVTNTTPCSAVTASLNGTHEYLFTDVWSSGSISTISSSSCTGACVYSLDLTNLNGSNGTTWGTTNKAVAGLAATGGATGIIIDNVSGLAGASQIYFSTLTSPGSAVQASQAGLQ